MSIRSEHRSGAAPAAPRLWPTVWAKVPAADAVLLPGLLVALVVIMTAQSPYFLTSNNLGQMLLQSSSLGIAAVGATYVIVAGDLDLSIGSNVALSGVVASWGMTEATHSVLVGCALGVLCGAGIGLVNGLLSAVLDIASFVVTLGTGVIATGLALYMTNGLALGGLPMSFHDLATTSILGVDSMVWAMLSTFLVGGIVLHRTALGVRIFAVGGNRRAAYLGGVPVVGARMTAFLVSGLSGGVAGVLVTSWVMAGQPNSGTSLTLFATAAVILGGTRISGGDGSVLRTFFGVLLIGIVGNGLNLLGVDYSLQQVVIGVVFVLAACSEIFRHRR